MALTLYYAPGTRASRVSFLLEELGVEWERVALDLARGENRTAEYKAIHPHGWVPALRDGEVTVFETAAICLYLADKFLAKGLAPEPTSPKRAPYYQWIIYAVATLEPAIADVFIQGRLPEQKRDPAVLEAARKRFNESAYVLARALEGPFLLGDAFSTADVLVGHMLVWADSLALLTGHDKLADYATRIRARPAFKRA